MSFEVGGVEVLAGAMEVVGPIAVNFVKKIVENTRFYLLQLESD